VNLVKRAMTAAAVVGCAASPVRAAERLPLADGGASDFRIVIAADASPSEKHAAAELQHFLQEISGAQLPIVSDDAGMTAHEILVGDSAHLRKLNEQIDWQALGDEGFVIKTSAGHLILAGGRLRGSMYAVYTFLEEVLGCRWFTAKVSTIPKMKRLEVGPLNVKHLPMLEYREPYWAEGFDADWAARNRMNSSAARLDEQRGGKIIYKGFVHTFYSLLPPEQYFKQHPEYYSEINGKRTAHRAQLCLTNPEVVRLLAERVKEWLRESPQANIVSVSQNDWGGWCECPNCKALDEREESHAGTMINFVNQVAEIVEKEFPRVAIDTLAYQYTRKPPKTIRPRHNVIVRLCSIECCFSHPLAACEVNRSFKSDLEGWAKVADRLYVWDYTTNFAHYIMPHPNLRVLKPNIQLYVKNKVRGIFEQGNSAGGGEFAGLRAYMLAKFLWDPDYDERKAMREFLEAVYGRAAGPVARYIALMHDKAGRDNSHCFIGSSPSGPLFSPAMIERARKLFDEAERVADNEEIRERVRLARLPIQYVELEALKPRYRVVGGMYKPGQKRLADWMAKQFFEVAERNGITNISETRPLSSYKERLELWSKGWPAVRMENRGLRVDVVPALGGRIVSIYDKAAKRELLLAPQSDAPEYPWSAGHEEYSERGFRSPGWQEEYEYREESPGKRLVMWAELPNGLKMERRLELSETEPLLAMRSRLVNVSDEEKTACLRVHPMFHLGPTDQVAVSFKSLAGKKQAVRLRLKPAQLRGQMFLEGDERPNGQWKGANSRLGLAVRQIFDVREVEQCLLDWLPSRQRFNLELSSPEQTLAPGEAISMTHRYQVLHTVRAR
jgi:hypothetical protein